MPTVTDITSEKAHAATPEVVALREKVATLEHQLEWFKKQLFGSTSEKRVDESPDQLQLFGRKQGPILDEQPTETISYTRGKGRKQRPEDCVTEECLRFDDTVPQKTIVLPILDAQGLAPDEYEIIGTKVFHKLAQRPASYVVIRYEQPVLKIKATQAIASAITPMAVFDKSLADVSFLTGMLVDKFVYHLPLYRQHQRLAGGGITLSRATLTNLVRRSIDLLAPIADAQLKNVLLSRVLAMDETPIKVGKSKTKKDECIRGTTGQCTESLMKCVSSTPTVVPTVMCKPLSASNLTGTIVSDGYAAYSRFAQHNDAVTHAQCWTHTRRQFVEAEKDEPEAVAHVLELIGYLYRHESDIKIRRCVVKKKHVYRTTRSKPIVDYILAWINEQRQREDILPKSPFAKALIYLANREVELSVFLSDADVPIDTNHLERLIRPIPMGRRYDKYLTMQRLTWFRRVHTVFLGFIPHSRLPAT